MDPELKIRIVVLAVIVVMAVIFGEEIRTLKRKLGREV